MDYGDAIKLNETSIRMKMAQELLNINLGKFIYSGQRTIRGILADVWSAEVPVDSETIQYSTVELFFSNSNYEVQAEDKIHSSSVLLGLKTYNAENKLADSFRREVVNHFYPYSSGQPMWKLFDISPCVSSEDRLILINTDIT